MRILVFRNGGFGDILTTGPVLRGLKQKFPDSEITYLTHWYFEELPRLLPCVDRVETVQDFLPPHPEFDALRQEYDLAIDLTMAAERSPYLEQWNRTDAMCDVAGVTPSSFLPEIKLEREPVNPKRIALQLSGTAAERCWPMRHSRRLTEMLVEDGYEVVLLDNEDIGWEARGVINLTGRCTFIESVKAMSACAAVIGPDSAMYHFAAALDVPFVVIVGAYNPALPLKHYRKKKHRLAYSRIPCEPCFLTPRCGIQPEAKEHRGLAPCMRSITPETVREYVMELLEHEPRAVPRRPSRHRLPNGTGRQKVLYLTPTFGCSGGIRVIFEHCNRLSRRGHDVFVASEDGSCDPSSSSFDLEVPVVSPDDVPGLRPDVVVATGATTPWTVLRWALDCRIFYLVQGTEPYFQDDAASMQRAQASYRLPQLSLVTVSPHLERWLKEHHGRDCELVENGVDEEIFFPEPVFEKQRARVLIEGPSTVPWKGVGDAFDIAGDLDVEVWRLSPTSDHHPGIDRLWCRPDQETVRRIYSSCDLLLKTSYMEAGTPLPVMEAMACACPVVAYDTPGIRQHCRHEENALLVCQGDVVGARHAVARLLSDGGLRARLAEGGLETALSRFSWEEKVDRLERALGLVADA